MLTRSHGMQDSPELFQAYHDGFRVQSQIWKVNPVDLAIKWLKQKPKGRSVADFGCGDAKIAQALGNRHTVHSFDLCAHNKWVTACNMANVPCETGALVRLSKLCHSPQAGQVVPACCRITFLVLDLWRCSILCVWPTWSAQTAAAKHVWRWLYRLPPCHACPPCIWSTWLVRVVHASDLASALQGPVMLRSSHWRSWAQTTTGSCKRQHECSRCKVGCG